MCRSRVGIVKTVFLKQLTVYVSVFFYQHLVVDFSEISDLRDKLYIKNSLPIELFNSSRSGKFGGNALRVNCFLKKIKLISKNWIKMVQAFVRLV